VAFGFVNPFTNRPSPPAARELNQQMPPWAYTSTLPGQRTPHPVEHYVIGHPQPTHFPGEQATPFVEGYGAAAGVRGRAKRHTPNFLAPGLDRGVRR
jgi:hypothetical protein